MDNQYYSMDAITSTGGIGASVKPCSICGKEKPLSEYNKKKGNADGRDNRCKPCYVKYRQELRQRHVLGEVEPYKDRPYKPRLSGRPWEVTHSVTDKYGEPLWPEHTRLTTIDISCTLKHGYFDDGMRIKNVSSKAAYTVATIRDKQVLKNKFYCLIPCNSGLKKVRVKEL